MLTAISPCPNDTYIFHAWAHQLIQASCYPELFFADIQQLNNLALHKTFPLIKVSLAMLDQILDRYVMLPVGAALGFHCGPKIIAKKPFSLSQLHHKTIAIPGVHTTAHYLLDRLTCSSVKKVFCLYHEIFSLIEKGIVDCGIVIHESRFIFEKMGFHEIADLGEIWQQTYDLPLPLGGIVAKRNFKKLPEMIQSIHDSINYANDNPNSSKEFILKYSQEKDPAVVAKHIDLYVNQETLLLSDKGISAIEILINKDSKKWLFS